MLSGNESEILLTAWGAFCRDQFVDEVGLPKVSPSCSGYEAPDWVTERSVGVTANDIDRACWAMFVLSTRHKRLHRDAVDHYRDGVRLGWQRIDQIRHAFGLCWYEWSRFDEPLDAG